MNVPNKIPPVFHTSSNYDYHIIIKELANEFEGKFECLGKNTEKCKTFFVPIEKEVTNIDKDGNESFVTICYKIKFIDNARFLISLSNLVDIPQKEFRKLIGKFVIVFVNMKVSRII